MQDPQNDELNPWAWKIENAKPRYFSNNYAYVNNIFTAKKHTTKSLIMTKTTHKTAIFVCTFGIANSRWQLRQ